SPYVNGVLYDYLIIENCFAPGASPPTADAVEVPLDPLAQNINTPVSSWIYIRDEGNAGLSLASYGSYFTGLTRDDVAGLRYLMSTNNAVTESGAAGTQLQNTNYNTQQLLSTTNLFALTLAAQTTAPATLQTLFPGLV